MMQVFISRSLDKESIFAKTLSEKGIGIEAQSLVEFSALVFELPPHFDWLFFYSKTGVEFFFKQVNLDQLPNNVKIAGLGPATAHRVQIISGRTPDFIGNGTPEQSASEFSKIAKGQTVLFARAADSRQSVQLLLQSDINVIEIIVYKNKIIDNVAATSANIMVFTSPLNAEAYFKKHKLTTVQQVIAIGNTTEKALQALGVKKIIVAESPDESALAVEVLKVLS